MEKMKALYEKVSRDSTLQAKFSEIMSKAEEEGNASTEVKLVAFAKEAGHEVSMEEFKEYFEKLSKESAGELAERELDMVAGGKSENGIFNIVKSVISIGLTCVVSTILGDCDSEFK